MTEPAIEVRGLTKEFGETRAVDDVSFEIEEGKFFSLLGPSGCGKSTTLRMLAGFEKPTDGGVYIDGEKVNDVPPYNRDVGMVFQSYALFPHKTVGENVGFGLKMEGVPADERREQVADILDLVGLPGTEDRSPTELSGGQQQRVALARALVIEPEVLLLDEPLSNLDLKLRKEMQFELKRIQETLGITTVYVTHDQEEALAMSDELLVLNDGQAEQIGSPTEVYNAPTNTFVADFMGESNILPAQLDDAAGETVSVALTNAEQDPIQLSRAAVPRNQDLNGDEVALSIRAEDLTLADSATENRASVDGTIKTKTFQGKVTTFLVTVGDEEVQVDVSDSEFRERFEVGDTVSLTWDTNDCLVLDR
ncbi:ABC transporter ATP-binding protein [Haloarchaeobius sp. HME9146]|uniref:ABC transporter ATP-binding protein n=1 Tax=Haloarchaeobius sp. HME9146 TaxID=2978732 RepID=UPI0021BE61A4|nr:ABC transporter ATP-binding protein [Haloarchaeobius sp. HME9146]MCT9098089.1 ABC transporter ATP-binding protein [Haloarchaeobius sp. HME9146]